jgi:hypothetical protein
MRMGNYLCVGGVGSSTMAASNQSVGVAHHTIVPVNFESEEGDGDGDEESTD